MGKQGPQKQTAADFGAAEGESISMDAGHGAQESSASCSLRALGLWVEFFWGESRKEAVKYFKKNWFNCIQFPYLSLLS
jgi:hypothetical protein